MTPTDPWIFLQAHTTARIAQGHSGHSLPTRAMLDFQLAHARARDAVYSLLDLPLLLEQLRASQPTEPILLHSQAVNRQQYLQRPDLGRKLDDSSIQQLKNRYIAEPPTLSIVVADGLSAMAVNHHAGAVIAGLANLARQHGWTLAPLCVVEQGRVAIADEIAYTLQAEMVVILIGERPGLTTPDSLGAYLTYRPRPGLTDAARNCVSNIRPGSLPPTKIINSGTGYELFIQKLNFLLKAFKKHQLSGIRIKDTMSDLSIDPDYYDVANTPNK